MFFFFCFLAQAEKCFKLKYRAGAVACGFVCHSAQDVRWVWLTPFFCGHTFSSFGVAELEQEVRCIIHRSVSVRNERLHLRACLRCVGFAAAEGTCRVAST